MPKLHEEIVGHPLCDAFIEWGIIHGTNFHDPDEWIEHWNWYLDRRPDLIAERTGQPCLISPPKKRSFYHGEYYVSELL
jgi:hypothetical protein